MIINLYDITVITVALLLIIIISDYTSDNDSD